MSNENNIGGFDLSNILPRYTPPRIDTSHYDSLSEDFAEVARLKREREDTNAGHLELTAQALRDMLALTQAENEAAKERDRLAQERDAAAKKRDEEARKAQRANLLVAVSSLIAAVLAVIAPFVIEAIKGWK